MRVHPEFLAEAEAPRRADHDKNIWEDRFEDIRASSAISHATACSSANSSCMFGKEQKKRFLERIDEPEKNWKFSTADVARARYWRRLHGGLRGHDPPHRHRGRAVVCRAGGQQMVHAAVVAAAVIDALASLDLHYPEVSEEKRQELTLARKALLEEA